MYDYCHIFPIHVYMKKHTYRANIWQLKDHSNLVRLSLQIYFSEEYHYTLSFIRRLHMPSSK